MSEISCIDLFCGVGGLTHGFVQAGLPVVAGVDIDPACSFPYETNNRARFLRKDIKELSIGELSALFGSAAIKILAGCAPCQPFSTYAQRYTMEGNGKWGLLYEFARLAEGVMPNIISMENVPSVIRHRVFKDFIVTLEHLGYRVWYDIVDSSRYGVPQMRHRLVLLASLYGEIDLMTASDHDTPTVRQAIGDLPPLRAGESSSEDRLHIACRLSPKNLERIRASKPGGSWRDWPRHLVADCHRGIRGRTYPSVYGRMEWDKPAPTMTTQCHGYGNGRFGHPEQDRAISLREAAILQSFPRDYIFLPDDGKVSFNTLGRLIGNAVPVALGYAIGRSILRHLDSITMS